MREPAHMMWYYKSLPSVPPDPAMKEYVTMVPLTPQDQENIYAREHRVLHLASEPFDTWEEADHFARAFVKHNYAEAVIRTNGDRYIVFGDALNYMVRAAYRWDTNGFLFCNWA